MTLPPSLRAVYALNAATFQVSSLALLSIVNTRVGIPPEYLPAYGAISFLPYSLRPIFAWVSSSSLSLLAANHKNNYATIIDSTNKKNRHDILLFPAFLLASIAFVGTIFIPPGGTVLCFVFGFGRGIAGAWSDFLIGMSVIEFSKLQARLFPLPLPSSNDDTNNATTYEHIVSVNTAQSSTAKNIGSFVASIAVFIFFSRNNRDLGEKVANTLLLSTAAIFLLASLVSLKYQFHVGKLLLANNRDCYDTIGDNYPADDTSSSSILSSGRGFELKQQVRLDSHSEDGSPPAADAAAAAAAAALPLNEDEVETKDTVRHWKQIVEVSTLICFQLLLAVSALQKPIIAISNQTTWVSLVAIVAIILVFTIYLGYNEQQQNADPLTSSDNQQDCRIHSQHQRLPHRQLNLYFLLRYSLPIAGFLMYSYLYTVFESEPLFLQLLSVLKSAIGTLSTFCYEKFLSPYCHSGWPLIGLIATLDIVMGLVALLDVWVVRAVREKEVNGEYSIDTPLRCLVAAVGLIKYFFAELDYMPALVLSTTNVYSDDEIIRSECGDETKADSDIDEHAVEDMCSLPNSSLGIDFCNEKEDSRIFTTSPHDKKSAHTLPVISAGMQYASFLSCIDFGAQIGD